MDIKKTHVATEVTNISKQRFSVSDINPKDSIDISDKAKLLAEVNLYKNMILSKTPDVRSSKVEDVRAKLESGYYSSDKVLNALSGQLAVFLSKEDL